LLTVLAIVAVAFAIAWLSVGWPGLCAAHGWCDPASFQATAPGPG
jgi:hypothetical protein